MLEIAREIAQAAADRRFKVLIVGGFVRDRILGIASKDLDCEIYGATLPEIKEFLAQFGDVEINHDARFPVFRLSINGVALEFCPPRRDRKVSPGPKGFEVSIDRYMTPREACSRRHYTVGAMAYDPLTGEIIDPFLGKDDLLSGILRATDKRYFADDPLRALIGFQLAGRFDLVATQDTLDMARQMLDEEHTVHVNAKWLEWEKWARLSIAPKQGL